MIKAIISISVLVSVMSLSSAHDLFAAKGKHEHKGSVSEKSHTEAKAKRLKTDKAVGKKKEISRAKVKPSKKPVSTKKDEESRALTPVELKVTQEELLAVDAMVVAPSDIQYKVDQQEQEDEAQIAKNTGQNEKYNKVLEENENSLKKVYDEVESIPGSKKASERWKVIDREIAVKQGKIKGKSVSPKTFNEQEAQIAPAIARVWTKEVAEKNIEQDLAVQSLNEMEYENIEKSKVNY